MKRYYHCIVTTNGGTQFTHHLRLMEFSLLRTLIAENKQVIVTVKEMPVADYNSRFGTKFPTNKLR